MNDSRQHQNFLDPPPEFTQREHALFQVLPVPFEATASYVGGTASGPQALLTASEQVEYFNGIDEPYRWGIYTHPMPRNLPAEPSKLVDEVQVRTEKILAQNAIPIILGGEHTVSVGAFKALAEKHNRPFGIVQFDAHADLRQTYDHTPYNHACVMRRALDLNIPIAQFGVRSLCREEDELRRRLNLPHLDAEELHRCREHLPQPLLPADFPDDIYITFDVDGLDPAVIAATGTPEPGGLSWYTTLDLLSGITADRQIIGFDLVELAPVPGCHAADFTAAKLVYTMLGMAARSRKEKDTTNYAPGKNKIH